MNIFSSARLFPKVGIDVGTARTRIWMEGTGVCLDEPSCLAIDLETKRVVAIGTDAVAMRGRVGSHLKVAWPMVAGSVADPDALQSLLKLFFQKAGVFQVFSQPVVMASVPSESTSISRDTLIDLLYQTGAREVYTIAQSLAGSIGAGVPIADASGTFLLQLGAGVIEGAVISLGSVVHTVSTVQAGAYATGRIQSVVKRELGLSISFEAAEEIKKLVVSASPQAQRQLLVAGQDVTQQSPKEIKVTSQDLKKLSMQLLGRYEQLLRSLLSQLPPELTVDVIDKGILLSGGLAQLDGIEGYLVRSLGIPVSVVEKPDLAVIRGIGAALANLELFKESLGYQT